MNKILIGLPFAVVLSATAFADDVILAPDSVNEGACIEENTGVYSDGFEMQPVYENISYHCNAGQYLPADSETCAPCLANNYCPAGDYTLNTTQAQGLNPCATGLVAPAGMWEVGQCGRKMHIGDMYVYLRSVKKSGMAVALNVDTDNDGVADFFGNTTTVSVPLSAEFANSSTYPNNRLVITVDNQTYYVYDDTVNIEDYQNP